MQYALIVPKYTKYILKTAQHFGFQAPVSRREAERSMHLYVHYPESTQLYISIFVKAKPLSLSTAKKQAQCKTVPTHQRTNKMLPFLNDKEGSGNTQEITELRKQLKRYLLSKHLTQITSKSNGYGFLFSKLVVWI